MAVDGSLRGFWYAYESLGEDLRRTPWGVVASDARYPRIYDANHAGVVEVAPDLTLEEIRAVLAPAMRSVVCMHEHIEFLDIADPSPALRDLRAANPQVTFDALMVFEGDGATPVSDARVTEVTEPGEDFWLLYRNSRLEFGDVDLDVLDQLVRRDREVFVPAGLRIFAGTIGDRVVGFASLISLEGVGYVDNVVTLTEFRRRGVASAVVSRVVEASSESGDETTFLFADDGGKPMKLYERLGFETRHKAVGFTRPTPP